MSFKLYMNFTNSIDKKYISPVRVINNQPQQQNNSNRQLIKPNHNPNQKPNFNSYVNRNFRSVIGMRIASTSGGGCGCRG